MFSPIVSYTEQLFLYRFSYVPLFSNNKIRLDFSIYNFSLRTIITGKVRTRSIFTGWKITLSTTIAQEIDNHRRSLLFIDMGAYNTSSFIKHEHFNFYKKKKNNIPFHLFSIFLPFVNILILRERFHFFISIVRKSHFLRCNCFGPCLTGSNERILSDFTEL